MALLTVCTYLELRTVMLSVKRDEYPNYEAVVSHRHPIYAKGPRRGRVLTSAELMLWMMVLGIVLCPVQTGSLNNKLS
jgi:hypothetical protein